MGVKFVEYKCDGCGEIHQGSYYQNYDEECYCERCKIIYRRDGINYYERKINSHIRDIKEWRKRIKLLKSELEKIDESV